MEWGGSAMTNAMRRTEAKTPVLERFPVQLTISLEAVLYVALLALAIWVRLAQLDTIPLSNAESREALAAWRFIRPDAPGTAPLAASPLMFAANSLLLTLFGGSEFVVRFMTVLTGTALVTLPLLWRRELGRVAALSASMMLTFSPVAVIASRTMSPAVWSMLLAVVGLWTTVRFAENRLPGYAMGAAFAGFGVLLLADPAGYVLLAILLIAWGVAVRLSTDDAPEDSRTAVFRAALAEWPRRDSLLAGAAAVFLVSTVFFLYPSGLTQVGQLLETGFSGLINRPAGHPFAFPLLATLFYEPALWFIGVAGVVYALREDDFTGRYLIGWLAGALIASLVYAGAGPDYALWLVVPLAAFAGRAIARLLEPVGNAYWVVPSWAVSVLALGILAMLLVSSTNFIWVARALLNTSPGITPAVQPLRLVLAGMSLLLMIIVFFLGGSLWGTRAAWSGFALGLLLFLGIYSVGSAWQLAVENIDNPRELWHVQPVNRSLHLLRDTLQEASLRETGGAVNVSVVAQIPDDGAVAWQLRDFTGLEYVSAVDRRESGPVIIAPMSFQPEGLGARYVGQDFALTRSWQLDRLRWADVPAWILFREAASSPHIAERVVVWVRDDVYGLPPAPVDADLSGEESAP